MRSLLQAAVVLLGVSLAAAQEPAAGPTQTNQAALPAEEELRLSLPEAGVGLNSPRTSEIGAKTGIENSPALGLFEEPGNVAPEASAVKSDEEVITAPLDSLQFKGSTEVTRAGGMAISGPLVDLFHTAKPVEVPQRLLHLINPFALVEANPVAPNIPNEHPRAWTALVGWNPGGSAFPDPRTHEPTLSLFSMFTSP
jgi:hypothetical protein